MIPAVRVLHITPELPYEPGGGGGRTHEAHLLRSLVELGHEVLDVVPITPEDAARVASVEDAGVQVRFTRRPAGHLQEAARAVAKEPAVLWSALRDPVRALEMRVMWTHLRAVAQDAAVHWRPDVALVSHDMAMAWADDLPPSLPAVLVLHNLTWNWYESRARLAGPASRAVLRAEAARYRRFFLRRLPRFHTAVTLSTLERDELRRIGGPRVELIPAGIDVDALRPAPEEPGP